VGYSPVAAVCSLLFVVKNGQPFLGINQQQTTNYKQPILFPAAQVCDARDDELCSFCLFPKKKSLQPQRVIKKAGNKCRLS
jgi:hypothetical protein